MNRYRSLLMLLVPAYLSAPAFGGIFFHRQGKPDAATRVPALIMTLRTDQDAHKREKAAQELRSFDPNQFPEIVENLVETAQNDPKTGVRMEAVSSLGKLRPVSQQAGSAIENATEKDSSMRVRLHARSVLVQYHLAGYRSSKNHDGPMFGNRTGEPPTGEPPLADPAMAPPSVSDGKIGPGLQPVAKSKTNTGSQPISPKPVLTNEPPKLLTPPNNSNNEGPEFP